MVGTRMYVRERQSIDGQTDTDEQDRSPAIMMKQGHEKIRLNEDMNKEGHKKTHEHEEKGTE